MPQQASHLPSITRFLVGLVTNRNPVDTPFSLQGLNTILHHDVLSDGQNTEVSPYDTMQRRPGWVSFLTGTTKDTFQYKDLNGNIFLLRDTGTSLVQGTTTLQTNSAGAGLWSVVGRGNFLYGTDGVDQIRVNDTGSALGTVYTWGQTGPQTIPTLTFSSLGFFNATTGFIPTADFVGGNLVVSDPNNQRTLTITINATTIHFNVTYTGNQISQNLSYTTVNAQTQTGTAPNIIDTNVITSTSGYVDNLTSAGTINGVMRYYPNTGVSTLDFDVSYGGTITLSALSTIINTQAAVNWPALRVNVPQSAALSLVVFTTTTVIAGLYNQPGQPPFAAQVGNALNFKYVSPYGQPFVGNQTVSFNSGLFDITNQQFSLEANIGSAPRLYQYQSPAVNVTDTFTGQIKLSLVAASTGSVVYSFTAQTLAQMAVTMRNSSWNPVYVQTGTTCYLILRNLQAGSPSATQDSVLTMELNSLVDLADVNLNFQNWTYLQSNDWANQPQQGVNIAYAIRDVFSGGLSNLSPPVTIGPQIYPAKWNVSLNLPYAVYNPAFPAPANGNQNIEVYRTVDGGSSYLYEQIMSYLNLTTYATSFLFTDDGLNEELIGPINEEADPPPIGLRNIVSHTGRLFGVVANRVYYSGGPDTINGNGDEAWPPGNYFAFPGNVTDILSMSSGLIVALSDDLHVIAGLDSSSYYAKPWLAGFGITNRNAWVKDGEGFYVYTVKQQLHSIFPGESKEIGFDIGDQLLANFPAATTSLTFHRGSALDTALYISNGTNTIYRYNPSRRAWSPKATPLVTAGRVRSLETSTGVNTLLNSTTGGVWARNLTVFSDNGVAYPAYFTIGVMQLSPQGQKATLNNIATQSAAVGTLHQVWLLFNEINSTLVPFTQLMSPWNDPPDAPPSQSLFAKRWYTQNTLTTFPTGTGLINLASIKIVFSPTDTVKNEVYGVFLRDAI